MQYEKLRRELNFQSRARKYYETKQFINFFKNKLLIYPGRSPYYNLEYGGKKYLRPYGFYNIIPDIYTGSNRLVNKNKANRALAVYKQKLNKNIALFKKAGQAARYSPESKRYVTGHPGLAAHLASVLQSVRRKRNVPKKYGTLWMERSGVTKKRQNAAKAKANANAQAAPQANYNAILSKNSSPPLNKLIKYSKLWLDVDIPKNSRYKNIALIIHPDKAKNRTHANNQAKRTALFKLLGSVTF